MKKTVSEICLIAPTEKLAENAKKIILENRLDIDVYVAALADAVVLAKQLSRHGAQVFVSRKGTKAMLEKELEQPVIGISVSLEDFVKPLEQLRNRVRRVAFLTYEGISEEARIVCRIMGFDVRSYRFTDAADSEECVLRAIRDQVDIAIGGATTAQYAAQHGLAHIIMENSSFSISSALETAVQVLSIQKEEKRKQEELSVRLKRYELIFNYTHDAIIAVDANGHIDVLNKVAEHILHSEKTAGCIGKNIDTVLPNTRIMEVLRSGEAELDQLMNIKGTMVSTNRIPITVGNTVRGVVATFQDVKQLQSSEQKIRIKLHEKGLTAKYSFSDIIGSSKAIRDVIERARSYAKTTSTVLIRGETGTGKELFAQSIHRMSPRSDSQFVAINCAVLPKDLLESELFGYEDGAFTGAVRGGKAGLFEIAHKGTIFLDEIGEMEIGTQARLLRVLQEKEIRRIGGNRIIPVDIRIITATNRDLKKAVSEGRFREDLFYRLNILNIQLPPLREREEDVCEIGLALFSRYMGSAAAANRDAFMDILYQMKGYPWPGNVRELQNFVERVSVLLREHASPDQLSALVSEMMTAAEAPPAQEALAAANPPDTAPYQESIEQWEKARIIDALKKNNLVMARTAKELGMGRTTLWRKIREYQIKL